MAPTTLDPVTTTREYEQLCPVAVTMDVVGDRWALLLIRDLLWHGPMSFKELLGANPGLSPSVLSTRAQALTTDGVIERIETPQGARYRLTERGMAAKPIIDAMYDFGTPLLTEVPLSSKRLAYLVGLAARQHARDLLDVRSSASLRIVLPTGSVDMLLQPGSLTATPTEDPDAIATMTGDQFIALVSGTGNIAACSLEGDAATAAIVARYLIQA